MWEQILLHILQTAGVVFLIALGYIVLRRCFYDLVE